MLTREQVGTLQPQQLLDFLYHYGPYATIKVASRLHGYISDKLEDNATQDICTSLEKIDLEQLENSLATAFLFFTRGFEPYLEPQYTAYKQRLTEYLIHTEGTEIAISRIQGACKKLDW